MRDENLPRIAMKPGGTANIDGAIPDQLQRASIPARKPTLPAYPPRFEEKRMLLSPPGCDENPFLFIIVVTSSRNFEARKFIRSSWGKRVVKSTSRLRESFQVIFVVGCDEVNDERVEKEAKTYGDILREIFFDSYIQNELHTVKTLLGLKWVTSLCNPAYILKVNSESFVNVHETIEWLRTLSDVSGSVVKPLDGLYTGYCYKGVKVVRNPQRPYFVSKSQWPDTFLPDYSSGVGVVLSRDVAGKMVQIAQQV